jgi:hypothetical protein
MSQSKSEVRAIKNRGFEVEYEWDEDFPDEPFRELHSFRRHISHNAPHAPNKNEAHVLRRIMSQTGLTEEQVRSHRKYRQELSQAQKVAAGNPDRRAELKAKRLARYFANRLHLPVWHADVQAALTLELERRATRKW